MNKLRLNFLFLVLLCGLLLPGVLIAQTEVPQGSIITQVKIRGTKLIDEAILLSNISSHMGDKLTASQVSKDIRTLFALGYFQDVKVEIEEEEKGKYGLIFTVIEKPRIRNLTMQGLVELDQDDFKDEVKVFANNMINLTRIEQDLALIKKKYRDKGYFNTRVSYEITPVEGKPDQVDLTFLVEESPKVYVTDFEVTGTKHFYPLDVERFMQTARIDCFSWITSSGIFQEDKVNQDLQLIAQAYMKEGFIKVKIDKPKVTITNIDGIDHVKISLNITEGERYFVGKVLIESLDGEELVFDKEKFLAEAELQQGEYFNPFNQNKDEFKLKDIYMERGYAFSQVQASNEIHEGEKVIDTLFKVVRQEKAYVGRVEIKGNFETKDNVIRRELTIHDNELFNGIKLRESQANITALGFFEQSGIALEKKMGRTQTEIDYDFNLTEAKTGSFRASLAYGGQSGLSLQLQVSKKNLFGTGRNVSFSIEKNNIGNLYNLSLVNPYWLDTDMTSSINLFRQLDTSKDEYHTLSKGYRLSLTKPIWKKFKGSLSYAYKQETYSEITDAGAEALFGRDSNVYSSGRFGVGLSTVDNPMFPTGGYDVSSNLERFGGPFGGTVDFIKIKHLYRHFLSLNEDKTLVLMAKVQQNQLQLTGQESFIPLHERFMLGGAYTVRGHEYNAIRGPGSFWEGEEQFDIKEKYPYQGDFEECTDSDPATICDTSLPTEKHEDRVYYETHQGGTLSRLLNLELLFPLTREGQNIRGVVFYDMGNVWSEDRMYEITGTTKDMSSFRKSAGFGVRFITPMGVLRFEYGVKLDKKKREKPSRFEFVISSLF